MLIWKLNLKRLENNMPTIHRPPTTEEAAWYKSQGIDPSGVTLHEEVADAPPTSATSAGARAFAAGVLPAAGAGLGAGAAMGALSGTALGGPVGTIIGGLGGALLGGSAVGAAQNAMMPDVWKEQLAKDAAEHPWATEAGQLATLPIGGMSPSGDIIKAIDYGASRLLGKVAGNAERNAMVDAAGKQAAINAGIGMSLGGVQEGVMQKLRGEDLDAGEIVKNTLIGGLFTKPTPVLGKLYGFHSTEPGALQRPGMEAHVGVDKIPETKVATPVVGDKAATAQEAAVQSALNAKLPEALATRARNQYDKLEGPKITMVQDLLAKKVPYAEISKMTGLSPDAVRSLRLHLDIPSYIDKKGQPNVRFDEWVKQYVTPTVTPTVPTTPPVAQQRTATFPKMTPEEFTAETAGLQDILTKKQTAPTTPSNRLRIYTGKEPATAEGSDLPERKIEARLAGEQAPRYMGQDESILSAHPVTGVSEAEMMPSGMVEMKHAVKGKTGVPSEEVNKGWQRASESRGIPMVEKSATEMPLEEGKAVLGAYTPKTKIDINAEQADPTTRAHEIAHDVWNDWSPEMRQKYTTAVMADFERVNAARSKHNETATTWNKANPTKEQIQMRKQLQTPEEYFALNMGAKSILRAAAGENMGWRNRWSDIKAHLKNIFGEADLDSMEREAMARSVAGSRDIVTPKGAGVASAEATQKMTAEESLTPAEKVVVRSGISVRETGKAFPAYLTEDGKPATRNGVPLPETAIKSSRNYMTEAEQKTYKLARNAERNKAPDSARNLADKERTAEKIAEKVAAAETKFEAGEKLEAHEEKRLPRADYPPELLTSDKKNVHFAEIRDAAEDSIRKAKARLGIHEFLNAPDNDIISDAVKQAHWIKPELDHFKQAVVRRTEAILKQLTRLHKKDQHPSMIELNKMLDDGQTELGDIINLEKEQVAPSEYSRNKEGRLEMPTADLYDDVASFKEYIDEDWHYKKPTGNARIDAQSRANTDDVRREMLHEIQRTIDNKRIKASEVESIVLPKIDAILKYISEMKEEFVDPVQIGELFNSNHVKLLTEKAHKPQAEVKVKPKFSSFSGPQLDLKRYPVTGKKETEAEYNARLEKGSKTPIDWADVKKFAPKEEPQANIKSERKAKIDWADREAKNTIQSRLEAKHKQEAATKMKAERVNFEESMTVSEERAERRADELLQGKRSYENTKYSEPVYMSPLESLRNQRAFIPKMAGSFDKMERISPEVAQAGRNWEARKDQHLGLMNTALFELGKFDPKAVERVTEAHRLAYRTRTDPTPFTGKDKEISAIMSKYYGKIADIRREAGMLIGGRKAGKSQWYVPDTLNEKTLHTLIHDPMSAEATKIIDDWSNYVVASSKGTIGLLEAKKDIGDYIEAIGAGKHNYNSATFGAIRRAAGFGLPDSIRELDPINALHRYGRRAATDLAMYQELESKPNIAGSLKLVDPRTNAIPEEGDSRIASSEEARNMMKWVTNDFGGTAALSSPKLNAVVRVVNNSIMGTATGLRDTATVPLNMIPYLHRWSDLGVALRGALKFRENSKASLETAARQPSFDKLEFNELLDSPDRVVAILSKAGTFMRKWQGREAIENFNRDITFSIGRELALHNIMGAKAGNVKSKQWLKKFSTLVEGDVTKLSGPELKTALDQMGKNFTDRNQGTYGGRGLPAGMIDNQFAPFLALQKWSVEKSNVIYQDVVVPFLTGENRIPMLTYTLGGLMTGVGIQELNKLMTGRKGQDPELKEALTYGGPKAIVSELATLMQLGSFCGIVSDGIKAASDGFLHGKTPRNVVSFPTATAAADLTGRIIDAVEAMKNGENNWDVMKQLTLDIATHNVQLARMVGNQTFNKGKVEDSDAFRDLRAYGELEGKPASNMPKSNEYLNLQAKRFKKTQDLGEAVREVPSLVKRAVEKGEGDPTRIQSNLRSLKQNSYQTMPAPDVNPMQFTRYYNWLVATQGKEQADKITGNYQSHRVMNRLKSSLIP